MSKNAILIYSSIDGQTLKISEYVKEKCKKTISFELKPIHDVKNISLNKYEIIIIGASIRYGKHNSEIAKLVKDNLEILNNKKTAFFSVNAVARKQGKDLSSNNPYVIKFLNKTKWKPDIATVFGGKIDYPKYKFFEKMIIRFIMFITKGPTDTSKSYEFTNWLKVEEFAAELNEKF
tara:strand:+ start:887 stop:1417 length:531 start_codon:yes stop_codon:yes gene_type:complete